MPYFLPSNFCKRMNEIDFIPMPDDDNRTDSDRPTLEDSKASSKVGSSPIVMQGLVGNVESNRSDVTGTVSLLLVLVVGVLLFYRLYPLVGFAYNTYDDRLLGLTSLEHGFDNWRQDFVVAKEFGRFFFSTHLLLMRVVFLGDYQVAQALNISLITINIVLFSCLLGRVFKSRFIGLLYATIYMAFINIGGAHNLLYSWPVVYQLSFLFGLLAAHLVHSDRWFSQALYPLFFILYFLFCILMTESVVLFLPLFYVLALPQIFIDRKIRWGKAFCLAIPTVIYCVTYFAFRTVCGSDYSGVQLATFDPSAILSTWFDFSFAITIPGMRLVVGPPLHWSEVQNTMFSPTTITLAFIVFATVCSAAFFARKNEDKDPQKGRGRWIVGMFTGFYLALCPNFLLALTPKYQLWNSEGRIVYTGSHFSLYGTSLVLLSLILVLLRIPRFRLALLGTAGLVVAIGFSFNEYMNQTVGQGQKNHIAPWDLANQWITTNSFKRLSNNTSIATPIEYTYFKLPPLSTFNYYSKYLSIKSGKNVTIDYVPIETGLFFRPVFYSTFMARGECAGYIAMTPDWNGLQTIDIYNRTPWHLSFKELYFLCEDGTQIYVEDFLQPTDPLIRPGLHESSLTKKIPASGKE